MALKQKQVKNLTFPNLAALTSSALVSPEFAFIEDQNAFYTKISGINTKINPSSGASSITASSGGATYKYNVLTGTPTVSYSKSSGTGTLTATGGTIQLIRFDDVILDSDRDVNTDFKWVLVGTGTTELFAIPSNVSKRTLSATNLTADASTNAVISNQFDIDNTPNIKYGNLILTGQGGITIRSNNVPAGNAGGNGYSFIW